jgi:hypothetical protein
MRHIAILFLIALSQFGFAQDLYNNIGLNVKGTGSLFISNSFTNEAAATYVNDAAVRINGNITNRQTTAMTGTGTTTLNGASAQQLLGNQAFYTQNLVLNNTSGGNSNFIFNGTNNLIVNNSLTFTDGIIVTNANNLTINSGATYSGSSDTKHVNGYVRKIGNQAFTFPVGDGSRLRTASISAPASATDVFIGKYFQATAPNDLTRKDAVLEVLSTCEYWTIDRALGASNVDVTLSWKDSTPYNCLGTVPLIDYYIGGWEVATTTWKSFANASLTGTTAAGTVTTRTRPTVYGPFILAKRNIPLPIMLISFDANMGKEGVLVSWGTTNHYNSSHFIVERSSDGISWVQVQKVNSQKESNHNNYYNIIDNDYQEGTNYYRLIEVSTKGEKEMYGVRVVEVNHKENIEWSIYPNPNNGQFIVQIKDNEQDLLYEIVCIDVLGKELFRKKLVNGINQINIDSFSAGTYMAKIRLHNHFETKKIVVN